MKIVVDLEDFWLDDESELIPTLQEYVKNSVIRDISDSIKKQVDSFMDKAIKNHVEKQLEVRVNLLMESFIENNKVKGNYSSDPELTVSELINKKFNDARPNIQDLVKKQAENIGIDLKRRYDLLFASQIVAKINEQGLLKDDVARLLLPKE